MLKKKNPDWKTTRRIKTTGHTRSDFEMALRLLLSLSSMLTRRRFPFVKMPRQERGRFLGKISESPPTCILTSRTCESRCGAPTGARRDALIPGERPAGSWFR